MHLFLRAYLTDSLVDTFRSTDPVLSEKHDRFEKLLYESIDWENGILFEMGGLCALRSWGSLQRKRSRDGYPNQPTL
jgi:hypothetical protein